MHFCGAAHGGFASGLSAKAARTDAEVNAGILYAHRMPSQSNGATAAAVATTNLPREMW